MVISLLRAFDMASVRKPAAGLLLAFASQFACQFAAASEPLQYQSQIFSVGTYQFPVAVPVGYVLELLSTELKAPRMLTFRANGDLFIGSKSGNVYRLVPPYDKPQVMVRLNDYPHSVAFRDDTVFIARTSGLYRATFTTDQSRLGVDDIKLYVKIPGGSGHNSRTVRVGPDGRVYVSLGIRGNCSDQYIGPGYDADDRRGGVVVLEEGGETPHWEPFATGLRNPVGFDWHPTTGIMYASNNGPDHLGYDVPPEYFSRLTSGTFHGMPWFQYDGSSFQADGCVGSDSPRPLAEVQVPVATFPARNAPMGVGFVPAGSMDPSLVGDAVVALRGSWGTPPDGGASGHPATRRPPKLVVVRFADGQAQRVEDLVNGFQLADGRRWARPVGVQIGPDGALYFTSDEGLNGLFRLRRADP